MPKDPLWYVLGLIGTTLSGTIGILWSKWLDERDSRAKEIAAMNIAHAKDLAELRGECARELGACTEARFALADARRQDADRNGLLLAKASEELQKSNALLAVYIEKEKKG